MRLLDSYCNGGHLAVYDELLAHPDHPEADAVAAELMGRVRTNLEAIAARWRRLGFVLGRALGEKGNARPSLSRLEAAVGPLPAVLRAFYDEIGHVDFVEEPPATGWPEIEQFDPLAIDGLEAQLERVLAADDDARTLELFADPLVKFGISGVGAVYVPLAARGFDVELWFEGEPVDVGGGRLVPYLRSVVLERGGIGPGCPADALPSELVGRLTRGLVPF